MDYPVPIITVGADGTLDLRDAYRTGPGAWDSVAIALRLPLVSRRGGEARRARRRS